MTKLTRKQHLEMAECLRDAKKFLYKNENEKENRWTDNTDFVCIAIRKVPYSTCHAHSTKDLLLNWIAEQLGVDDEGFSWTFQGWVIKTYPEMYHVDIQVYRHAWVDHMIGILES